MIKLKILKKIYLFLIYIFAKTSIFLKSFIQITYKNINNKIINNIAIYKKNNEIMKLKNNYFTKENLEFRIINNIYKIRI